MSKSLTIWGFWKSKKFGHWTLWSGGKKTMKQSEKTNKKTLKKKQILRWFYTLYGKSFQIGDHFFPLLFPEDSKNLKSFYIGLWEVGEKRPVNGVRKCDGQTHTWIFRLIERIGPEGWFFENWLFFTGKNTFFTVFHIFSKFIVIL